MSSNGSTRDRPPAGRKARKKAVRKPPPQWRRYLTQAELELAPPPADEDSATTRAALDGDYEDVTAPEPAWWQTKPIVAGLGALCLGLAVAAGIAVMDASRAREAERVALMREQTLTLRAITGVHALRIAPNPRSWSAKPDAVLAWPEPPQLLELHLPIGYAGFLTYALTIDKVDQGRVLTVERMAPDSNQELQLSLNSSAFGPGEYRVRIQGYTWRGERVDAGWVRLQVTDPR